MEKTGTTKAGKVARYTDGSGEEHWRLIGVAADQGLTFSEPRA